MKQFFTSILLLILTTAAWAQAPNFINYQAVARDNSGQALVNKPIKIRISLNQSDNNGSLTYYSETRTVTTNALGLFNVQIGGPGAESQIGNINNTNWLDNSKIRTISVGLDLNNGLNFTDMGNQQLVSVPYALAANTAKTAEKLTGAFIGFSAERYNTIQELGTTPFATLTYNGEYLDSTNTFNPATGKFTAPETGLYVLNFSGVIYSQSTNYNEGTIGFKSSSQGVLSNSSDPLTFKVNNERSPISYSQIVRLTAGETVEVLIQRKNGSEAWQGYFYTFIGYKLK
jgi:hypothetical protein